MHKFCLKTALESSISIMYDYNNRKGAKTRRDISAGFSFLNFKGGRQNGKLLSEQLHAASRN